MGLMAAIALLELARRLGLDLDVRVYEAGAFGGGSGDRSAGPRCQLWWHRTGTLYACSQPAVTIALQRAALDFSRLAPDALAFPPAFALQPPGMDFAAQCFRVLGVPYEPVPRDLFRHWYPAVRLPDGYDVLRTGDGTIDLRLLSYAAARRAQQLGAELTRRRVVRVGRTGDRADLLILDDGRNVQVGSDDVVVCACGARLRGLLADMGAGVPGLRLFRSELVATDEPGIPALLAVLAGGVNCVPHLHTDGRLVNIFGDGNRVELPPETDTGPVPEDPACVARLCSEVEDTFGFAIPSDNRLAWSAVKTEIVPTGTHSQAHHACLVPSLQNVWVALPGKLSQTPTCASDLAVRILRERLPERIARPIWEGEAKRPCE